MGAEIKEEGETGVSAPRAESGSASKPFPESGVLFKDLKEYRHLTKEQREELTQRMMGHHRQAMRKLPGMGRG